MYISLEKSIFDKDIWCSFTINAFHMTLHVHVNRRAASIVMLEDMGLHLLFLSQLQKLTATCLRESDPYPPVETRSSSLWLFLSLIHDLKFSNAHLVELSVICGTQAFESPSTIVHVTLYLLVKWRFLAGGSCGLGWLLELTLEQQGWGWDLHVSGSVQCTTKVQSTCTLNKK